MPTRVLVVDDNVHLAENLAEILADEGYETVVADGPAQALEQARSGFDVAILDVRMPGMDGVSLFGELRRDHPTATYLLMTAFIRDERLAEAVDQGIGTVLPKPVPISSLLAHLPHPGRDQDGVLIVEDEASLAEALVELLRAEGFPARAVGSLAAARRALDKSRPRVVVCDVRLPDGDGAHFAGELSERTGLGVVVITAFDAEQARAAAAHGEADQTPRVLTKPFPPERLIATLAELSSGADSNSYTD
ncbi:MAG TPA: response regulator [Polyangiaceae bacterium LLY-WYZ-14_1]|jgi:DNA-binding response OmpR family regulator|nr:response regulator [Polyangiaceae bacterium LLY-WYZ-14_1]